MQDSKIMPTLIVVGAPQDQHGYLTIAFGQYRHEHISSLDNLPNTPAHTFQAVLLWEQAPPTDWRRIGVVLMTAQVSSNPLRINDEPQVAVCEIGSDSTSLLCRYPLRSPCGFITRSEVTWVNPLVAYRFGGFVRSQRALQEALAKAA